MMKSEIRRRRGISEKFDPESTVPAPATPAEKR
jgi:hypothetical protein